MNKTLKITISIALFFVFLITVVPYFINWNQYKSEISEQLSAKSGYHVELNGDIRVSILPSLAINIADVSIKDAQDNTSQTLSISMEKLSVEMSLLRLLKKEIELQDISLIKPNIRIKKNNATRVKNNTLKTTKEEKIEEKKISLSFDQVTVKDGSITYIQNNGEAHYIDSINTTILANNITGPFKILGDLKYQNMPINFEFMSSQYSSEKPIHISAILTANQNINFNVEGKLNLTRDQFFDGVIETKINNLNELLHKTKRNKSSQQYDLLKKPIALKSNILLSKNSGELNNLTVSSHNNLSLKGSAKYTTDQVFDIRLSSKNIDLQDISHTTQNNTKSFSDTKETYMGKIDDLAQTVMRFVGLTMPDIQGQLNLNIEKLILSSDSIVSGINLSTKIDKNALKINKLSAKMNNQIDIDGSFSFPLKNNKVSQIDGEITTNFIDDFLVFKRSDKLQTNLSVTKERIILSNQNINAFGNIIEKLSLNYDPNKENRFLLNLATNEINLNKIKKTEKKDDAKASQSLSKSADNLLRKLQDMRLHIIAKVNKIIYKDYLIKKVNLNSRLVNKDIIIESLSIDDLKEIQIVASGKITDTLSNPQADLSLKAVDKNALTMNAIVKGTKNNININMDGQSNGKRFEGQLTGKNLSNLDPFEIDVKADLIPLKSLSSKNKSQYTSQNIQKRSNTWSKDPIDFSFLKEKNGVINIDIKKLTYDNLTLNNFTVRSKVNNNQINLENLSTNLFSGDFKLSGDLKIQPNQSVISNLSANAAQINIEDILKFMGNDSFSSGQLSLTQTFNLSGKTPFDFVSSLNGSGNILIENGSINGIDLDGLAAQIDRPNSPQDFLNIFEQAKAGGSSKFETINVPIHINKGIIKSDDITAKSEKTKIDMQGYFDLPDQKLKLDGNIIFTEQRNMPPLGVEISGPIKNLQKRFKTEQIIRFYTQKTLKDLGGKAIEKLFGQPRESSNQENINERLNETTPNPTEQKPETDIEDVLKEQGKDLLRGLLNGG